MLHVSLKQGQKLKENKLSKGSAGEYPKSGAKNLSRKKFFQRIGLAALIPFASTWYSTAERTKLGKRRIKTIEIPPNLPAGISFFDSVIVSKKNNKIEIFSSKCTHLGCKIDKTENDELVCPCHGSQFAGNGNVVKGPANKSLKKLPFKINPKTGEITVNVVV